MELGQNKTFACPISCFNYSNTCRLSFITSTYFNIILNHFACRRAKTCKSNIWSYWCPTCPTDPVSVPPVSQLSGWDPHAARGCSSDTVPQVDPSAAARGAPEAWTERHRPAASPGRPHLVADFVRPWDSHRCDGFAGMHHWWGGRNAPVEATDARPRVGPGAPGDALVQGRHHELPGWWTDGWLACEPMGRGVGWPVILAVEEVGAGHAVLSFQTLAQRVFPEISFKCISLPWKHMQGKISEQNFLNQFHCPKSSKIQTCILTLRHLLPAGLPSPWSEKPEAIPGPSSW